MAASREEGGVPDALLDGGADPDAVSGDAMGDADVGGQADADSEAVADPFPSSLWAIRQADGSGQWTALHLGIGPNGVGRPVWVEKRPSRFDECECDLGDLTILPLEPGFRIEGWITQPFYDDGQGTAVECWEARFVATYIRIDVRGHRGVGDVWGATEDYIRPCRALQHRDVPDIQSRILDCEVVLPESGACFRVAVVARALRETEADCSPVGEWLVAGQRPDVSDERQLFDVVRVLESQDGLAIVDYDDFAPAVDFDSVDAAACGLARPCRDDPEVCAVASYVANRSDCGVTDWQDATAAELHAGPPAPWLVLRAPAASCDREPPFRPDPGEPTSRRIYRFEVDGAGGRP